MRAPRLLAAAAALLFAVLPAHADQILPQGRIVGSDLANGDILFGALKLGKRRSGKTTLQPDAIQIQGSGSTGPIDGMSTQTGSVPLAVGRKLGERVSVQDFAADATGGTDASAAFQSAINSVASGKAVSLEVPAGTWRLNSDVASNGRIVSWRIAPGAVFTGTGKITDGFGFYYDPAPDARASLNLSRAGSASVPVASTGALDVAVKHTSASGSGTQNNATSYRANYKYSTANGARVQAYFGEAIDQAGGVGSFVEGGRFHGIVAGGTHGASYGLIGLGQGLPGTTPDFVIGVEGEVIRQDGTDAPAPIAFAPARYMASFVATSRAGDKADAGFLTNPYNAIPFRTGFMVPQNSVSDAGFVNRAAASQGFANLGNTTTSLYTGTASYAAIQMLNGPNSVIRIKNGAGTADHNVFDYNSSNQLELGTDAAQVSLVPPIYFKPQARPASAAEGTCIWNASTHKLECFDGSTWNAAW